MPESGGPEYSDQLAGKRVVIFPDNDDAGQAHASKVARSLTGKAESVRIASVPVGKDVSDWIAAGATRAQIQTAINAATCFTQGKLKHITQGMGRIKATRRYENPIEFPETHKLWMDTNSKPAIRAADDQATFNRLHPIQFTVTIPDAEIDKTLPRKLLAEAEGILAWAVAGARKWWQNGLGKPPEVAAANDDWRSENDQLGRFHRGLLRRVRIVERKGAPAVRRLSQVGGGRWRERH